ncbi:MAG: hypothetical protein MHMPM18_000245 [Marteilia pararefringens]
MLKLATAADILLPRLCLVLQRLATLRKWSRDSQYEELLTFINLKLMANQLAVCVSILIFAVAFLVSVAASLFLANHRPSARSRNGIKSSPRQSKRSNIGSSSSKLNGRQGDPDANKRESWQKGDIVEGTKRFKGQKYTFLEQNTPDIYAFWGSDSSGRLVALRYLYFTRIDESKYEDKNYKFQEGDEVEMLANCRTIKKGAKGEVIRSLSSDFCYVRFSDNENRTVNTWYLGKLKQKN